MKRFAMWSGGKDSSATIALCYEMGIEQTQAFDSYLNNAITYADNPRINTQFISQNIFNPNIVNNTATVYVVKKSISIIFSLRRFFFRGRRFACPITYRIT